MKGISILIPVFNEERIIAKNVKGLVEFLDKLSIPYEILLCDNGSTDRTPFLGRKLESQFPEKVKFFSIPQKRSVGSAFKEMVKRASFDKLISVDMDLSFDFKSFIPKCVRLLDSNSMVIGTKISRQKRPLHRKIMSKTFIFLTRLLLGLNYSDYSIGAKGYRKSEIMKFIDFLDEKSFYVIELVFFLKRTNHKIVEIPIEVKDVRRSRFNIPYDAMYRGIKLLNLWLREKVMKHRRRIPARVANFPRKSMKVSP